MRTKIYFDFVIQKHLITHITSRFYTTRGKKSLEKLKFKFCRPSVEIEIH